MNGDDLVAAGEALYLRSALRESILEHRFLAEIGTEFWSRGVYDFSVSHAEVDSRGYDVVIEALGRLRRIQLKAVRQSGATRAVPVQKRLFEDRDGCVVLMRHPPEGLAPLTYAFCDSSSLSLWGGELKVARQPKPNAAGVKAEKSRHRGLPLRAFEPVACVKMLVERLFGPAPVTA